jgi:hypothetical protein
MSKKLSAEGEIIAAYGAAMTAAFQVLITTLQNNGPLERGEFQDALRTYMEVAKHQSNNEIVLALLHDLRRGLMA